MSTNRRIGLIVAAVVVAVLAFVIASPGGDDKSGQAARTTIQIRAGKAAGGPAKIHAKKGDTVVIVVKTDRADDIHLHGYDIEKKVAPGQRANFRFTAMLEGEFEIESHAAEDAGRDPLLGTLIVEPK